MTNTSSDVTQFLSDPKSYGNGTKSVELRETHISQVFLTERFAYKLKKPVRFAFLDFSTVENRRHACEQEVHLNKRLAPDVYLKVVPIYQCPDGGLAWKGEGEPIDWVVKMKRLEDRDCLESKIKSHTLRGRDISKVADLLARFYVNQAPLTLKCDSYRKTLLNHIESNKSDLLQHFSKHEPEIRLATSAQLRFIRLAHAEFNERVCDGRIVDGHGDLRPEHIYLSPNAIAIDCIEFNDEFRQNDIVDELSFLKMECERLGAPEIGATTIDRYSQLSSDCAPDRLVAFYMCYRACVRAKVAILRSEQALTPEATKQQILEGESYLDLASSYVQGFSPRLIVSVGGLMGTGKSTIANRLAEELVAPVTRTDDVRETVFPSDGNGLGYGRSKYSLANRLQIYDKLVSRVPTLLASSSLVVLDGTFARQAMRDRCEAIAKQAESDWLHIECTCPRAVSLERIVERQKSSNHSSSEARPELYDSQSAEYESPTPGNHVLRIDTSNATEKLVEFAIQAIRDRIYSCVGEEC
ncbi:MAG: AAA family ATPase [Planctomycetales bacterium]|nr:AAA family ATPase [Planctomycetales bacterium]